MIADSSPEDAVAIDDPKAGAGFLNHDNVMTDQVGAIPVPDTHGPSPAHVKARPPAMTAVTTVALEIGRAQATTIHAAEIARSKGETGMLKTVILHVEIQ